MQIPTQDPFTWTDRYLLGHTSMDQTHHEFVEIVNAMLTAADADFAHQLDLFAAHAEQHFSQERDWMASSKFPPMQCHVDEHNAVLKSVYEVKEILAAGGNIEIGRGLAKELTRWFPAHADYMDAALAQWLVKQSQGGVPVVVRRGIMTDQADS
jgi:hemerythrin